MQKLVLLALILSTVYSQNCWVKIQSLNVYPTDTEYFDLNLENLFYGQNLTFTVMGGPPTVETVNYIQPLDLGGSLPDGFEFEAAAIRLHQVTELWDEQIAILGNVNHLPTVFFSHLSYAGSPTFAGNGKTLLQQQYAYNILPNSLTWIDNEYVMVDTWFVTQIGGPMVNSWQRLDSFDDSLPAIFLSSNNQNHMGGTISRQTQFYRGPTYRTLSNNIEDPNFLEVFRLVDNIPDQEPCGLISTNQIPGMQMVDFEVSNVGEVWILNWSSTLLRFTMTFAEDGSITFRQTATYPLPAMSNYLAIDIEVDYKTPLDKTFSILIANTNPIGNILEYTLLPNSEPIFVGYYSAPIAMKYTGVPPNIDSNIRFVSVQYNDYSNIGNSQVYLFERVLPTLNIQNYQPFHVDSISYSRHSYWHSLNEQPSMMLTLDTQMFLSVVEYPQIYGQFLTTQTGTMTVTAFANTGSNPNPNTCHVDVHFVYLPEKDTSIQYANPTVIWPTDAYFPKNHTLDFSKYLNGPAINISGTIETTGTNNNNLESGLQNLPQVSSIIQTTVLPIQMTAPSHYPKNGVFVKNAYNDDDQTFLQFVQDTKELQAFICYQGEYDAQKTCYFVDQSDTANFTIGKLEVMWPLKGTPYVYCFSRGDVDNHNVIIMWALDWDHSKLTGYFNYVSSLEINIDTGSELLPIPITDFTVVDQQLYITLNQINQIWEYEVVVNGAMTSLNRSLIISNDILGLKEGFSPIGCEGNTKQYGPVLIINNQYEFVIISTLNNHLKYVSNTQFPLTTPGLKSSISISGEYLVVCQNSLQQSLIAAYSLYDLTKPILEKMLPLYGAKLYSPLQVTSDEFFFFAVLEDVSVNVYRPSAASHETLFHQFKNYDPSVYFHFSSVFDGTYAYLSFINSTVVLNKRLQKHLTAVFEPGAYSNAYFTKQNYKLTATNVFGATPLVASHDIQIFNSQVAVNFDERKFNASNGRLYATTSKQNITLNTLTSNFLTGAVAEYSVKCDVCPDMIKVINKVSAYQTDIKYEGAKIQNVNAMIDAPATWFSKKNKNTQAKYGSIVATVTTMYLVNELLEVTFIQNSHSNTKSIADCQGLAASEQFIVTACELKSGGTDFQVLPVDQDPVYFTSTTLFNPTYIEMIGQTLFVLGTDQTVSAYPVVLVYNFNLNTKIIGLAGSFKCSDKFDDGVNDFAIGGSYSYSNGGVNYKKYILFYTCKQAQETPYYVTVQLNTATNEVTLSQQNGLIDPTKLQILVDTYFFQVQPLRFITTNPSQTQVGLFVSTSNVMNFIFNFVFDLTISSEKLAAPLVSYTQVTTIPPYGDWTAVNALTFQNQILVLPYDNFETRQSFIAAYDISAVDYTKVNQPPTLMSGGFYAPYAAEFYYQLQQYTPGKPVILLTSSSNDVFNLSSIIIQKDAYISINSTAGFESQKLLVTAGNYFDKKVFNFQLSYAQPVEKSGLKWWGWLLIVLSVILVIAGGAAGWVYFKNKQSNVLPLLEQS